MYQSMFKSFDSVFLLLGIYPKDIMSMCKDLFIGMITIVIYDHEISQRLCMSNMGKLLSESCNS